MSQHTSAKRAEPFCNTLPLHKKNEHDRMPYSLQNFFPSRAARRMVLAAKTANAPGMLILLPP